MENGWAHGVSDVGRDARQNGAACPGAVVETEQLGSERGFLDSHPVMAAQLPDVYAGGMAFAYLPAGNAGRGAAGEEQVARVSPGQRWDPKEGLAARGDSSMLDTMERGWHGCSAKGFAANARAVRCGGARGGGAGAGALLEYKRLPALTWWVETACALGGVALLPLLSLTPCSTSAVRADALSACRG